MSQFLGRLWRGSWLLTLPLTLLGAVWLLPIWRDARQFLVFHPADRHASSDVTLTLNQLLRSRLNLLQADLGSSWKSRWIGGTTPLGKVDLEVSPANLALLNERLPLSGKTAFVPAMLRYPDGNFEEVAVRYRGDSLHHWGFAAKSWLIRTEKDQLIDGQRRWHVVLPRWRSVGNYHLNLQLAADLGLLSVSSTPVDLRVNGRQHGGIHLLQPQIDETFLQGRLEAIGDIYVGDMTWLDDNYVNEQPKGGLWELPWLWQKAAFDPAAPETSTLPLEILISAVSSQDHAALIRLLDLDAWARFSAYMQLVAANHMDQGHNWKLYYDPTRLVFVPIVGDGNGLPDDVLALTAGVPGRDLSITTPLLALLHRDHAFLRRKNQALAAFFREGGDRRYFDRLNAFAAETGPSLRIFPQLDWIGLTQGKPIHYFDDDDLRARIAAVSPQLRTWFGDQRAALGLQAADITAAVVDASTLRVAVAGRASARLSLLFPDGQPLTGLRLLIHRAEGSSESVDLGPWVRVSESGRRADLDLDLLARRNIRIPTPQMPGSTHEVAGATYDLKLAEPIAAKVRVVATDGLGSQIDVSRSEAIEPVVFDGTNTGILPNEPVTTRWAGQRTLTGLNEVRGTLEIAPGSRLRMAPGASLIVRGKIVARGRPDQPIRIEADNPAQPWGVIAVIDPDRGESTLEHCLIAGGSALTSPLGRLDGMITVRGAGRITLTSCRLTDAGENALSVARSALDLNETTVLRTGRNGIGLFRANARLSSTRIEDAGTNAIEATHTDLSIDGGELLRSRDHGVLARGKSRVAVINSLLSGHIIGLHALDGANLVAYNTSLEKNQLPLAASRQTFVNPDLSRVTLAKCAVGESPLPFDLRDESVLTVIDSRVTGNWQDRQVRLDSLSNDRPETGNSERTSSWGSVLAGDHWNSTNPAVRGRLPGAANPTRTSSR